jgi:non-specific serine/threonine protein kinase
VQHAQPDDDNARPESVAHRLASSFQRRRRAVEEALSDALSEGLLTLHYQPEVNLHTGSFVAVETLVRLPQSNIGAIGPDEFVPIAEQSDLIDRLGRWVLSGALSETAGWTFGESHPAGLLTAVNISPHELLRPDFVRSVLTELELWGFDPRRLCLEVTETAVVDAIDPVVRALRELHAEGVRLAIDDFGTGHASLDHLAKFPVEIVKVDRSFVAGLTTDRSAEVIVESVIAMAHALGKEVVAEGVETHAQLEMLLDLGCDVAQGYLFARPENGTSTHATLQAAAPWPTQLSGRRTRREDSRPGDSTRRRRVGSRGSVLPAETNSFIGRKHEIAEAKRLLESSRMLTLTGPGGVGKTRMSLRIAEELRNDFPDGIWYVELAELREPLLFANTVAEKLRLRDQSSRTPLESVAAHLANDTALLILDNCEHLIDAAAEFAGHIVRSCPAVRILATSRQTLGLTAETALAIAPFQVPDTAESWPLQTALSSDAVKLFMDRAMAVLPSFVLDSELAYSALRLVGRLDGIPLAIELAAARLRSLSLPQLEERLSARLKVLTRGERNAPSRRQTLRGAIDWSYDLCSEAERRMWARVSVFSGGFDLDAAERICSLDPIDETDVLDLVEALIDKSILVREAGRTDVPSAHVRYRMLETIREYGEERLVEFGEQEAIQRRHRDWYASIADQFEAEWMSNAQIEWVARMTAEHPNMRLALDHFINHSDDALVAMRLITEMEDCWTIRGQITEARQWLDEALARTDAHDTSPVRVGALRMNAWFALLQGDAELGPMLLTQAEQHLQGAGYENERAYVVHSWGMAMLFSGQVDLAIERFADGLTRFREVGNVRGELFTLFIGGYANGYQGLPRGRELLAECIETTTASGEIFWRSWALWALSQVELIHGSVAAAHAAAREALVYQRKLDNRLGMAFTVGALAAVAERNDDHERAALLFGAADLVWLTVGASPEFYAPVAVTHNAHLAMTKESLGVEAFTKAHARGMSLGIDEAVALALT